MICANLITTSLQLFLNGDNPLLLVQGDTYKEMGVTVKDDNEQVYKIYTVYVDVVGKNLESAAPPLMFNRLLRV